MDKEVRERENRSFFMQVDTKIKKLKKMLTFITIYGKIIITRGEKHRKNKEMEVDQ